MHVDATFRATLPVMQPLADVLAAHELTQADLAQGMGLSRAAANRLVKHGLLPARKTRDVRQRLLAWLAQQGVPETDLHTLQKVGPAGLHPDEAVPPEEPLIEATPEEKPMLIPQPEPTQAAVQQFALHTRNPFAGEVTCDADMFTTSDIAYAHQAAWQAVIGGRMVAIVGESGAGKTTMLDEMRERILRERLPVVCITPSVAATEDGDSRGTPLRTADLYTAIAYALDKKARVPQGAQRRSQYVRELLEKSTTQERQHLLIIEEAHATPATTLNQLKRLNEEMRLGRRYMLGILLIGHPELAKKLTRHDVRESMQRTSIVRLPSLGAALGPYLHHRAQAAGRTLDEFITPEGVDELRTRLTVQRGPRSAPLCMLYPLNVNNWMTLCLNTAAGLGAPRIDRDVVRVAQPDALLEV